MLNEHQVGKQEAHEEESSGQLWSLHGLAFCVQLQELVTKDSTKYPHLTGETMTIPFNRRAFTVSVSME